jgi:hypothetical protein
MKTLHRDRSDGIKQAMRKIFLVLTAIFVLSDAWVDARETGCHDVVCVQACHSVCQTHFPAQKAGPVTYIVPPASHVALPDVKMPRQLFDKFVFRPPKVLA